MQGMANLTMLTTAFQLSAGLFLPLLPKYRSDLAALSSLGRSTTGGAIFLAVIGFSLLWAIVSSALNIALPGWAGES